MLDAKEVVSLARRRMSNDIRGACRVSRDSADVIVDDVVKAHSNIERFAVLTCAGMDSDDVRPFLVRHGFQEPPQGRRGSA